MLSTRTMQRLDWKRIEKRTYRIRPCEWKGVAGKISFLRMDEVTEPIIIESHGRRKAIVQKGYVWIQAALEQGFWWMTAMFDETGAFQEVYIDMTNGNRTEKEDPEFEDLFLDYVLFPEEILELDKDELMGALALGEITKEQAERTLEEGRKLKADLVARGQELIRFFEDAYRSFTQEL